MNMKKRKKNWGDIVEGMKISLFVIVYFYEKGTKKQVEIRVFWLYYNRQMQRSDFIDYRFEEPIAEENLFGGAFSLQDCKVDASVWEVKGDRCVQDVKMKKKGRPKGEKNSSTKERKSKGEKSENRHSGHWRLEENKRYHWFLEVHHLHFIQREMRRLDKIFKTMSKFISTREAEQCRSHHQKMEKKFSSFSRILLHLRQQHYGTSSAQAVHTDICKQFQSLPMLLTEQELKNLEKGQSSGPPSPSQQTPELTPEPSTPTKSQQDRSYLQNDQPLDFDMILDDNYEHQFSLSLMI